MRYQRGSLLIYSWLGAAAVMLVMGIALKVYAARLDAAQQKVTALEQQVAQWTAAAKECSDATLKAKEAADKASAAAQAALQAARKDAARGKDEIARLKAQKPSSGSVCPAGEAVAKVREGLR